MYEVKELLIFLFWQQHWEEWQDFDMAADPCGDQMQGMSRLVFAVVLTLSVHYYVEVVSFLVKEPNLCKITQTETV